MIRYLVAVLIGCLIIIYGGYQRIESQAQALKKASNLVEMMGKAAQSRRTTQRLLAQLDRDHTKELENAQADNQRLRTAVGNGARRLSVEATCPAVGAATATSGVGHEKARAELDPAAGERIVAIANDGDEGLIALRAAQDYINTFCQAPRQ
ncbi:lysis protein [Pseudomonas sp. 5P_3.1_Bac2]|uniref:lysis protein n=1 Tax=Pseudomonas sp. 5P_3.1_Bac2 TaxID=2971617 RepID=UPI0021C7CC9B|nr:lysis protein [Pseudomonas sp. 5P_3.1_Bac2]MCU1717324.1 lysis protein [Pseudomonas sp. 5P_3.1_Bac2]